jgi:DNA transposition AAA+ family ATPase
MSDRNDATVEQGEQAPVRDTSNINISGDTVKQALADLVRREDLTPEQESLIWWFYCHARTEGFDLKEAAKEIGKDTTTLYRVWTGKYGASLANICLDIARYRKLAEARATRIKLDFVETSTWRKIEQVCDAVLQDQTVAFIWGDSQIGKTTALDEYARRNNHGQTKLVRMPASSGVQMFMKELARSCFVSTESCFDKLRDRVLNAIDNKTLVIVDELHQAFTSYNHASAVKVFELIREIYDRTHCGMVLVGTNVLRDELHTGKLASILEQLRRRGTIKLQLPPHPPKVDLDKIARKFGLPPADGESAEVIKDMIHTSGMGMYIKFLQSANMMASREGKKISWDHFVQANDIIAKLSRQQ